MKRFACLGRSFFAAFDIDDMAHPLCTAMSPIAPALTSASARWISGSPSKEWFTQTRNPRAWLS